MIIHSFMILTDCSIFWLDPSLYIAIASALIGLAALIVSICVAAKESKNHFERTVEQCLLPVSIFIQDTFVVLSEKVYGSATTVRDGEKKLIEGIHSLFVFASTNHYNNLAEACTIRFADEKRNANSFAFCLFELEDKYIKFRKAKALKVLKSDEEKIFLGKVNLLFRDFLDLLSKYIFVLKGKHNGPRMKKYYKGLAKIYKEVQELLEFPDFYKERLKIK